MLVSAPSLGGRRCAHVRHVLHVICVAAMLCVGILSVVVSAVKKSASASSPSQAAAAAASSSSRRVFDTLVFEDTFDDGFDLKKWEHEITAGGGGNWEFQYYTNNRSNSYVRDGVLYLKPTLTADKVGEESMRANFNLDLWGSTPATQCTGNQFWGCFRIAGGGGNIINPIQSARVRTANSFSFKYGRMETRVKLPRGDWLWPAIWLLPRWNAYGDWPASGEIDLMESRGNVHHPDGGIEHFGSTIHAGPFWFEDDWPRYHAVKKLPTGDFASDFHIYGLYWSDQELYTYIDKDSNKVLHVKFDEPFWKRSGWDKTKYENPWTTRSNAAPFDQEFYLIFNVAVGGTGKYFADGAANKPWSNSDPHAPNNFWAAKNTWYPTWEGEHAAMQIDWVRVWQ